MPALLCGKYVLTGGPMPARRKSMLDSVGLGEPKGDESENKSTCEASNGITYLLEV